MVFATTSGNTQIMCKPLRGNGGRRTSVSDVMCDSPFTVDNKVWTVGMSTSRMRLTGHKVT